MGVVDFLFGKGIGEAAKAAGGLAKDIRSAVTGERSEDFVLRKSELDVREQEMQKELDIAQAETNTAETQSIRFTWRMLIGWSCALGYVYLVFYNLLVYPIDVINYIFDLHVPKPSQINDGYVMSILFAMSGVVSSLRTFEKIKKGN